MLTNYNKVVELIKQMNTEQVSQAEAELNSLAQVDKQIIACLHNLLKDSTQEEWVHTITAATANKLICDVEADLDIQFVSRILLEILTDVEVLSTFKRLLERSIVHVIDNLEEPALTTFREVVSTFFSNEKLRDTGYLFIGCWTIPEIDIGHVIHLSNYVLKPLIQNLGKIQLSMAAEINEIIKTWALVWDTLAKHGADEFAEKEMRLLIQWEPLTSMLGFIYEWEAESPLYISTKQDLLELNVLKNETAELHISILNKAVSNKALLDVCSPIYELTMKMMERVMKNIQMLSTERERLDNFMCKDFTISLIKLLRLFVGASPSSFTNYWREIFSTIIIPFIEVDSDQIEQFEECPEDFIALQEDCAEKQTYGILKSESCALLEQLADKSEKIVQGDFIPNFSIRYAVDSIMAHAGLEISNSYNFNLTSINTALTVISIFSYRLKSCVQQCEDLKNSLTFDFLKKQNSMQRAKLYFFMGYSFEDIYSQEEKKDKGTFWIQAALSENQHPTVNKCCLDFLSNVADEYYSDFFFQALTERVLENMEGALWEAIGKLITTQSASIREELMQNLINKILMRLEMEIEIIKTSETKLIVVIINLIQLLQVIANLPGYCNEKAGLKESIWRVTDMLDLSIKYNFQDEIISIILAFVKQENQILPPYEEKLGKVLQIFKLDYSNKSMIVLLNEYIMKDRTGSCIPAILKTINTANMIFLLELSQKAKNKNIKPVIMGYFLVLFQNLIFLHKDKLSDNDVYTISATAARFIPEPSLEVFDKILAARALNILLICHLIHPTDYVWNQIYTLHQKEVFFSYDISVLESLIEIQVFRETDFSTKGAMLSILATVIDFFMKRKQKEKKSREIRLKFNKQKSRIKTNRYLDYEVELKKMTTPFTTGFHKKRFIQLVKKVRETYPQAMGSIFKNVSEAERKTIREVANVMDLQTGETRKIFTVVRPKQVNEYVDAGEDDMDEKGVRKIESDSEEEMAMKRERKVKKRKNKEKGNGNKIDSNHEEMNE